MRKQALGNLSDQRNSAHKRDHHSIDMDVDNFRLSQPHLDKFPMTPENAMKASVGLGGSPSPADVAALRAVCSEVVTRQKFLEWHYKVAQHQEDTVEIFIHLLETLGLIEGTANHQTVPWNQLCRILTSAGDRLSLEEFTFIASQFTNVDGEISVSALLEFSQVLNNVPLISAWDPGNDLPPQQFSYTIRGVPAPLFEKSNPVLSFGDEERVITVLLSPSDVVNANVRLSRPRGHRIAIESYRLAFEKQFHSDGVLKPAKHLLSFFGGEIDQSMVDSVANLEVPNPVEYKDNGFLASVCSQHLPVSYPVTTQKFRSEKAIVWLCVPGENIDTTPEFYCIGGWTRWCALQDAMDSTHTVKSPTSASDTEVKLEDDDENQSVDGPALDYAVPVYILNGSELSELEIHCLSVWLNMIDSGQIIEDEDLVGRTNRKSNRSPEGGHKTVLEVKSRPYGLADYAQVVELIFENVIKSEIDPSTNWRRALREYIETNIDLSFLWYYIRGSGTTQLPDGDLEGGLLSFFNAPLPAIPEQVDYLCEFLISFFYPYDYRHNCTTIAEIRANKIDKTYFWERVLFKLIPYTMIRCIEPFLMVRSKETVDFYRPKQWNQNRTESFVSHFINQTESVSRFVTRLCNSEKIREMKTKNVLWPYDSLASCTCFYNYHFLIELDSEIAGKDEIPDTIGGDEKGSHLVFKPGTQRALLTVRSILLYAALTFQNPSFQFQLARKDYQRAPLEKIVRPKLFEEALFAPLEGSGPRKLGYAIDELKAEQCFEGLLGVLAELVFRCVCSGTGKSTLYVNDEYVRTLNTTAKPTVSSAGLSSGDCVLGYIKGMMQGGALAVQYLFTASYCKNAVSGPVDQSNVPSPSGGKVPVRSPTFSAEMPTTVDAILPLATSTVMMPGAGHDKLSYHCFQIASMVACRRRIYENCLLLQSTGFDPGNFSHLHILFNVLMLFHERGYDESTETARELLLSEGMSISLPDSTGAPGDKGINADSKSDIIAKAITQIHDSWNKPSGHLNNTAPRTSTHNPEARTRIIRWFEETKTQARELMNELYMSFKARDGSVVLACDFRDKTPEEAKAMAGVLSELAADSTNLSSSLQEVPYQFGVVSCSQFRFSQNAVDAVLRELGPTMRHNLEEGLTNYLNIPDASDVVVVSARPGVICALWQSLAHLSPFFDLLHPLACQWLSFRALFTSWLWGSIRENMMAMWKELCQERLPEETAQQPHPALRFTLRRLPARFDKTYLSTIIDLTPERLSMLFRGPGPLDKIGAAFYRFQCSSMADARSVLGSGASGGMPLVKDLNALLQCQETCLKPLFEELWDSLDGELPAEDVLNDSQIAAAGFLKKYAKYVLNGLETQDRSIDSQGRRVEPNTSGLNLSTELSMESGTRTRKRKVLVKEEEAAAPGRSAAGRKVEDLPKSILAGYGILHELKRDLKLLCRVDAGQHAGSAAGEVVSRSEWLNRLPTTLRTRLENEPLPKHPVIEEIMTRFCSQIRALRTRQIALLQTGTHKRRRLAESGDEEMKSEPGQEATSAATEISSVFYNLPVWLKEHPLWSMWGSALRKDTSLYTIPNSQEFTDGAIAVDSEWKLSPPDWEIISVVLDYLCDRGVTAMYCARTKEVFPLTTRGAFSGQAFAECIPTNDLGLTAPAPGIFPRRNAMSRFKSILEGDLLGYRRDADINTSPAHDTLTSCLL